MKVQKVDLESKYLPNWIEWDQTPGVRSIESSNRNRTAMVVGLFNQMTHDRKQDRGNWLGEPGLSHGTGCEAMKISMPTWKQSMHRGGQGCSHEAIGSHGKLAIETPRRDGSSPRGGSPWAGWSIVIFTFPSFLLASLNASNIHQN